MSQHICNKIRISAVISVELRFILLQKYAQIFSEIAAQLHVVKFRFADPEYAAFLRFGKKRSAEIGCPVQQNHISLAAVGIFPVHRAAQPQIADIQPRFLFHLTDSRGNETFIFFYMSAGEGDSFPVELPLLYQNPFSVFHHYHVGEFHSDCFSHMCLLLMRNCAQQYTIHAALCQIRRRKKTRIWRIRRNSLQFVHHFHIPLAKKVFLFII